MSKPLKVADIRPEDVMEGQKAAMREDIDWLKARRDGFVDVACPACEADNAEPLYEKYGLQQIRCADCRTQYVSPRPAPETLEAFYAQSKNYAYWAKHVFPASQEARRERLFRPRAEFVDRLAGDEGFGGGVLVEVGAAYGLFCEEVGKLGTFSRVIGVEPTSDLAGICRGKGIEIVEAPYERATFDGPVDLIASFEVIEHLFSPADFLRWCHAALRPGGWVVLTCPNIAGFETVMLGAKSETVDHKHLNLFTPDSLTLLAERTGFDEIAVETPGELDVDLVRTAWKTGVVTEKKLGQFLASMLDREESKILENFQQFLSANRLSSNMRMLARRPRSALS